MKMEAIAKGNERKGKVKKERKERKKTRLKRVASKEV